MKCGVVVFPGSNCDKDMVHVLGSILNQNVVELWHKDPNLKSCDLIVLPGGFSYGDYLRSGAIARFSPIMNSIVQYAQKGGLLFGICNGFQVLCEAGLLPGSLLHNSSHKFICKNLHIKPTNNSSKLTRTLQKNKPLKIPIAHGEGRYFDHPDKIKSLWDNNQVLFQYCNEAGEVSPSNNPNGSIDHIAGVCNKSGNVFGMMPHPERAADHLLRNTDGLALFESILNLTSANHKIS